MCTNYQGFSPKLFLIDEKIVYQNGRGSAQSPPLYLPKTLLQLGHLCMTDWKESMQKGMRQHGMHPTMQRTPAKIHCIGPVSDSMLLYIWAWQFGHTWLTVVWAGDHDDLLWHSLALYVECPRDIPWLLRDLLNRD